MSKSIKLSKKHGVNPTIPICFWCGKEKNEVVLLGHLEGNAEAPMCMWIPGDYEPCEKCKQYWTMGIVLAEAYDYPILYENQPSFHGAYPTGVNMVLTEKGVKNLFTKEMVDQLIEKRLGFVDHDMMEQIQKIYEEAT